MSYLYLSQTLSTSLSAADRSNTIDSLSNKVGNKRVLQPHRLQRHFFWAPLRIDRLWFNCAVHENGLHEYYTQTWILESVDGWGPTTRVANYLTNYQCWKCGFELILVPKWCLKLWLPLEIYKWEIVLWYMNVTEYVKQRGDFMAVKLSWMLCIGIYMILCTWQNQYSFAAQKSET